MNTKIRHKRLALRSALVCLCVLAVAGGCALFGGGGEGSWARAETYTVTPGASWKKREPENSDKAYQLSSGALATVTSSCNRHPTASLQLLTKHLLMGTRDVNVEKREDLKVGDADGLLSKVTATMEGTKFHMLLVVSRQKNGCVFDFSLVSPKTLSGGDEGEFLDFVRSYKNGKH